MQLFIDDNDNIFKIVEAGQRISPHPGRLGIALQAPTIKSARIQLIVGPENKTAYEHYKEAFKPKVKDNESKLQVEPPELGSRLVVADVPNVPLRQLKISDAKTPGLTVTVPTGFVIKLTTPALPGDPVLWPGDYTVMVLAEPTAPPASNLGEGSGARRVRRLIDIASFNIDLPLLLVLVSDYTKINDRLGKPRKGNFTAIGPAFANSFRQSCRIRVLRNYPPPPAAEPPKAVKPPPQPKGKGIFGGIKKNQVAPAPEKVVPAPEKAAPAPEIMATTEDRVLSGLRRAAAIMIFGHGNATMISFVTPENETATSICFNEKGDDAIEVGTTKPLFRNNPDLSRCSVIIFAGCNTGGKWSCLGEEKDKKPVPLTPKKRLLAGAIACGANMAVGFVGKQTETKLGEVIEGIAKGSTELAKKVKNVSLPQAMEQAVVRARSIEIDAAQGSPCLESKDNAGLWRIEYINQTVKDNSMFRPVRYGLIVPGGNTVTVQAERLTEINSF